MKKDIEWLKREIYKELETWHGVEGGIDGDGINEIMLLLNQLDEPEVLSSDWIKDNQLMWASSRGVEYHVPANKLYGKIVPKQEEVTHKQVEKYLLDKNIRVIDIDIYEEMQSELEELKNGVTLSKTETVADVIPKFVAKWISVHHEQFDLYPALKRLENNALSWEDVYEWYRKNTRKFVSAYLTGKYVVEEEQKYYVLSKELHPMLCESAGTDKKIMESITELTINEKGLYKEQYALTEQEIKDYDPRYMTFAKPVEELEE